MLQSCTLSFQRGSVTGYPVKGKRNVDPEIFQTYRLILSYEDTEKIREIIEKMQRRKDMKVKEFIGFCKVSEIVLRDRYTGQIYTCVEKYLDREVTGFYPRFSLSERDGHEENCKIQIVALINHDFSVDSEEETNRLIRNRKIESHRRQIEALQNCESYDMAITISRIAYHEKAIEDLEKEEKIMRVISQDKNMTFRMKITDL